VTSGRAGLDALLQRQDCSFLVRLIEPPESPLPAHAQLLLARPPHREDDEIALMWSERITHLVSKNSGGAQTSAKLAAAHALHVNVVMIGRPFSLSHGPQSVEGVLAALHGMGP